jgi:hypothetical protein
MAAFLEASDTSSSEDEDEHNIKTTTITKSKRSKIDPMMEQDAKVARQRMQDVGYREGKTELIDANANAQASFETGLSSGFKRAERAGRVRGMMVTLVTMFEKQSIKSTSNIYDGDGSNVIQLVERMKQDIEQIQLLPNPTLISKELMASCEKNLLALGFKV